MVKVQAFVIPGEGRFTSSCTTSTILFTSYLIITMKWFTLEGIEKWFQLPLSSVIGNIPGMWPRSAGQLVHFLSWKCSRGISYLSPSSSSPQHYFGFSSSLYFRTLICITAVFPLYHSLFIPPDGSSAYTLLQRQAPLYYHYYFQCKLCLPLFFFFDMNQVVIFHKL